MRLSRRGSGRGWSRGKVLPAFALLVTVGAVALGLGSGAGQVRLPGGDQIARPRLFAPELAPSAHGPQQIRVAYSHLPLIFEPNQGQSDPQVKFLAPGSGYGLFLTTDEAVLALQPSVVGRPSSAKKLAVVRMKLAGANANPSLNGTDQLPGKSNYFIGNDPARWHHNVPQFARVRYQNVYPGIDLTYYGKQGRLEYDFEVAPGADPKQVILRFQGTNKLRLDAEGELVLTVSGGEVRLEAPRVYQKIGQEQKPVAGRFALLGRDQVGLELGPYDRSRALVIDPVLTYSTYLGGSGDEACSAPAILGVVTPGCPAIAVDSANGIGGPGNIYVAGSTTSSNFPTTTGVFQPSLAPGATANAFVAKFDPTGSSLIFSTYLGGNGTDTSAGVAVDSALNVYVAGSTTSSNFPTNGSNTPFQGAPQSAGKHVFVSELDPTGHTLLYSTYLSGNGTETATGLALDVHFKVYVSGTTTSTNPPTTALFPATLGAFQTCPGENSGNCASGVASQFFFSKLDPTLSGTASLVYSTYLGGSTPNAGGVTQETLGGGIAVDTNASTPNVYLTGGTDFTDMPVLNASQGTNGGGIDAWVAKFTPSNPSGTQEIYLTYLGGSGDEIANGVAVDSGGTAYITGSITTANFTPTLPSGTVPFQTASGGGIDAFVGKLGTPCTGTSCTGSNGTNVPLNYFSYLGGSGTDVGLAVAVDSIQGARLTGWTNSPNFPHPNNPVQSTLGGGTDAFVARIDTTAASSTAPGHFSTYLGGSLNDFGTSIATDSQANTFVAGETASSDFLTVAPPLTTPFQGNLHPPTDAFVSKLGPTVGLSMTQTPPTATPTTVGMGNQVTFKYTITNTGDLTTGITFSDTVALPPPAPPTTFVSATASPGSCGSVVSGAVLCNVGTLNAGATATVTIILTPTAPTTPNPAAVTLPNSATANVTGSTISASASAPSVTVNDFDTAVAPATSPPILAGTAATYTVTVTPTQNSATAFPDTVALSCSSGLPTGATCAFTNGASIPNLNNGPQSRQLVINTTVRPTPTAGLWQRGEPGGPLYATWLPVSGLALLGLGMRKTSRKRRWLMGLLLGGFFALVLFQAGCGSSGKSPPPTGGTPAGTYTITVTATSGSATRTAQMQLVVQ